MTAACRGGVGQRRGRMPPIVTDDDPRVEAVDSTTGLTRGCPAVLISVPITVLISDFFLTKLFYILGVG